MHQTVTILDVVDNFLTRHRAVDFNTLPGKVLWKFGNEVRRFADSYNPPVADTTRVPMYLGGWPSANFYHADEGQLVLSTLLYSGQVFAKDPLSNWFSKEQYQLERPLPTRAGYLLDNLPNITGTRGFLNVVVPALRRLRPLIESGALVLVPTTAFLAANFDTVQALRAELLARVGRDVDMVTGQFHPRDLAHDDRVRGMFVFAGGNREEQLRKAISSSLRYFSEEWLIAQHYGLEYTAPFSYEQYVCEQGLGHVIGDGPHQRVVTGLLHTRLPLFQGLSPKVVADVRDDDSFGEFRASLLQVYKEIPRIGAGPHFARDLAQTEETLLHPVVERTRREAERGRLRRAGIAITEVALSVGSRVAYDAVTGDLGMKTAGRELIGILADRFRARGAPNPNTAWITLHRHHRTVADELPTTRQQAAIGPGISPWSIETQPSMSFRVTPGAMILDDLPVRFTSSDDSPAPAKEQPPTCECGSGLPWNECCRGLPTAPPTPQPSGFWAKQAAGIERPSS